jgi:hypothetical protein
MHSALLDALLGLQLFQVLFLSLHDWIPLGRLNDVEAARAANPGSKLLVTTIVSAAPFAFGFAATIRDWGEPLPGWLMIWLWASYGILFLGQLRAWWIPYLLIPEPPRAARYDAMFGRTWAFLPVRNGITPNTLHIMLHLSTLVTLIVLAAMTRPPI